MHLCTALLWLLLYTKLSASLVPSNAPRSSAIINHASLQIIRPANLIQAENQTDPLTTGTYYDIGSNLTIYMILGNNVPAHPFYKLLLLAKERTHHYAALYGPNTTVPRSTKYSNLTQTTSAGLVYFIKPSRAVVPHRPGLEWGEFKTTTSWLFEHRRTLLNHRECNFVLFRRISRTTGQEINLGFGVIKPLNTTMTVHPAPSGSEKLFSESMSHDDVEIN